MVDEIHMCDWNTNWLESNKFDTADAFYEEYSKSRHHPNATYKFSPVAGFPNKLSSHLSHDKEAQTYERHCLYKLIEKT
jgi:hypothetical protein